MTTLKDRLIKARAEAKLSQADLAARAHCGQTTIASIENGRNKGATPLVMIAAVLGVRPMWLVEGMGPMRDGDTPDIHQPQPRQEPATDAETLAVLKIMKSLPAGSRREILGYARALAGSNTDHDQGT